MSKNTTNENDSQWGAVLEALSGSLTKGQYATHFLGSTGRFDGSTVTVSLPPSANLPMVENQLQVQVFRAVQSVTGRACAVRFEQGDARPIYYPESGLDDSSEREFVGAYHNEQNAIIRPDKKEWAATRYFREKWRPLLGPLLSELVRELRQLCHYDTQRNSLKTTYKTLADALGVSEPTIKRALKRDKSGKFQNEYLGYFIADMRVIKYSSGRDKIRNEGTQFIVYLDEPLTPDDKVKLSSVSK